MEWTKQSNRKTLLGQLLIDKKLISEEQLARAIEHQRKTGQRLGDVIAEWNLVSTQQVAAVLRKQRLLRMAAFVTAVLGPMPVYAAGATAPVVPITTQTTSAATQNHKHGGLRVLSDTELSETVGQGVLEDTMGDLFSLMSNKFSYNIATQNYMDHQFDVVKKPGSGLKVLADLGKMLNPVLMMFSSDMSIKDVVYAPGGEVPVINKDGSITLSVPSRIGEIRFDNIRVRGNSSGPSFGSIAIRDIDMRGTTITIKAL